MTDQTAPAATNHDRRLAREWAESIKSTTNSVESTGNPWSDRALAAARVILNDLPAPPPPTLADMTEQERAACQWLQADVKGEDSRVVIVNTNWINGSARIMRPTTRMAAVPWESVTPRPDLPRMAWPGDTPRTGPKVTFSMPAPTAPAPALPGDWRLADHPTHGRVVVTKPTPDADGNVYFVLPDAADSLGYEWLFCTPDRLTYIDTDQEDDDE